MKTRWLKKFTKKAQSVKMTARDKRAMLSRILGPSGIPSPYSFFLTVMEYRHKIVVAAMCAAFVITSGGTSFAASSALPGEALYSIKVNINEEIQSFVAVTPDAKAKVGVQRTEKRLEEAETLSKSGKLDAHTQAIIEDNIERHSESIKENIADLAEDNATSTVKEVISNLNSSLEGHQVTLSNLASSTATSTSEHLDEILLKVNEVKKEIDDIGQDVEDKDIERVKNEEKAKNDEKADVATSTPSTATSTVTSTSTVTITTTTVTSTTTVVSESE